ncbi:uncharacterized protein SPSK_09617 [Sporothrix schenckii 1099-18]|uniref:Uncharacterized protein n=1 Tax=Sporothrix schenckii 1099-18 TaxID=1397361 RepID=A0A0F2M7B4_SPOSC|nr:uncharacterized protein SPSK_09617 [Sporothrix schenckii 1099-18]KJR84725.1 hypothetical protein SPSK_09617 [Sporothrix schenckii 1099-18]
MKWKDLGRARSQGGGKTVHSGSTEKEGWMQDVQNAAGTPVQSPDRLVGCILLADNVARHCSGDDQNDDTAVPSPVQLRLKSKLVGTEAAAFPSGRETGEEATPAWSHGRRIGALSARLSTVRRDEDTQIQMREAKHDALQANSYRKEDDGDVVGAEVVRVTGGEKILKDERGGGYGEIREIGEIGDGRRTKDQKEQKEQDNKLRRGRDKPEDKIPCKKLFLPKTSASSSTSSDSNTDNNPDKDVMYGEEQNDGDVDVEKKRKEERERRRKT